jgi:hypothetical protein
VNVLGDLAHNHFLPEPDSPELEPFRLAFMRMLFAHAEFERRVAELADVIALKPGFGETEAIGWFSDARPKKFRKLCADHQSKHPNGLPEADDIARCLEKAFDLGKERNWFVHGVWWRIDPAAGIIDVHTVRVREEEPLSRTFTVKRIDQIAESFKDVEVELWKLQRAVRDRLLTACKADPRSFAIGLIRHGVDEARRAFLDCMAEIDPDRIADGKAAALFDTFAGSPQ